MSVVMVGGNHHTLPSTEIPGWMIGLKELIEVDGDVAGDGPHGGDHHGTPQWRHTAGPEQKTLSAILRHRFHEIGRRGSQSCDGIRGGL